IARQVSSHREDQEKLHRSQLYLGSGLSRSNLSLLVERGWAKFFQMFLEGGFFQRARRFFILASRRAMRNSRLRPCRPSYFRRNSATGCRTWKAADLRSRWTGTANTSIPTPNHVWFLLAARRK